ncbi:hypothetical protein KIL84_019552 [Mauremys mutica]|uniref:Uncharacterized protein n=1 Tax=Mauremys mutica TaxID=74926 RepID=A0A9D3XWT7_9SAUR|nr:hypothetical protein KIL84_019552 [Mauremys mutica]
MSDNEDNFDGDDFDDVEEDEGLDDLENAEEHALWHCEALLALKMWDGQADHPREQGENEDEDKKEGNQSDH